MRSHLIRRFVTTGFWITCHESRGEMTLCVPCSCLFWPDALLGFSAFRGLAVNRLWQMSIARLPRAGEPVRELRIAGRLMAIRGHGKASFSTLNDRTGNIQVYFKMDVLGERKYKEERSDFSSTR